MLVEKPLHKGLSTSFWGKGCFGDLVECSVYNNGKHRTNDYWENSKEKILSKIWLRPQRTGASEIHRVNPSSGCLDGYFSSWCMQDYSGAISIRNSLADISGSSQKSLKCLLFPDIMYSQLAAFAH